MSVKLLSMSRKLQYFLTGNPNTIVKIAVRLLGHDVGECRKPFIDVSAEGMNKIKQVLTERKRGMD